MTTAAEAPTATMTTGGAPHGHDDLGAPMTTTRTEGAPHCHDDKRGALTATTMTGGRHTAVTTTCRALTVMRTIRGAPHDHREAPGAPHGHDDEDVTTKITMVARAMTTMTTRRPRQPGPQRHDDSSRGYPTLNHPQWQRPDEGAPYGIDARDPMRYPTAAVGEMAATQRGTLQQCGGEKRWL